MGLYPWEAGGSQAYRLPPTRQTSDHMLIILILLGVIIIAWLATRTAWRYHVAQLRAEREKRNQNYHAARVLADHIDSATWARDYYRAALLEITRVADENDPAGIIARRSLSIDQESAA